MQMAKAETTAQVSRVPHGTRGLKSVIKSIESAIRTSRPAWDAWIEMQLFELKARTLFVASRMGRVD